MPAEAAIEKGLPRNIEAERCVLGAVLLDNHLINQAVELLSQEDFYLSSHRTLFQQMVALLESSKAIDLVTLSNAVDAVGQLEAIGGRSFISSLIDEVPRLTNLEHYARIVQEKSTLRRLIKQSNQIISSCYEQQDEVENVLDNAERAIFDIAESKIRTGFVSLGQLAKAGFKKIEAAAGQQQMVTGIPSGFTRFDELTSGFQPSDLVVIAARPAMGKTTLALNIASRAALGSQKSVGVFSLEMAGDQLLLRILCSEARTDAHRLRTGRLSKEEWATLAGKLGELSTSRIFIDDTPGISLLEMRAKARRLRAESGLDLLIVDYLQLVSGGRGRFENRQQEISSISRGLKALAKELEIPVIALSQLSRAPEQRTGNHRPQLSDLRESGSIEQDADLVAFIFREELYKKTDENQGVAELIIGKQRNGPTGKVDLVFLKEYTRFESLLQE